MSGLKLDLTVELLSDFHVGTGFGLARTLDDRLLKDQNGQPYLPGSTVKGLIRDATERLLELLPLKGVVQVCQGEAYYRSYQKAKLKGQLSKDAEISTLCGVAPILDLETKKVRLPDWYCPLCRVFGTTYVPASFTFTSAYFPNEQIEWANELSYNEKSLGDYQINSGLVKKAARSSTMKAAYNRIDRKTGRAEDAKLFSLELGTAGLPLKAAITELYYPADPLARLQNWVMLAAGCAYVEELGKRRRRGSGRCLFQLAALPDALLEALALETADNSANILLDNLDKLVETPDTTQPAEITQSQASADGYANRYLVVAFTEEPLIVAQRAEAGNTTTTLPYINGTSLRGGLATAFLRRQGVTKPEQLDNSYQDFESLFGIEQLRFSNLLPAKLEIAGDSHLQTGEIQSSIPSPRSLLSCKLHKGFETEDLAVKPHGVTDFLLKDIPEECPICGASLEGYNKFLLPDDSQYPWDKPTSIEPSYEVIMHNEVDDRTSRAEDGRLFSYKVLQRGQWFAGVIEELTDNGLLGTLLDPLGLKPEGGEIRLRLGRGNNRGQGQVKLQLIPNPISPETGYQPVLLVENSIQQRVSKNMDETLSLLLMSDCILQDKRLCYLDYIPAELLVELLGLPEASLSSVDLAGKPLASFCSTRIVEGWNAAHGMPRETDIAIEAGSVFSYRIAKNDYPDLIAALQRLERKGLGLRRDEGFGQVVFNHPIHTNLDQLT